MPKYLYEETFTPWWTPFLIFFPLMLPCFCQYHVRVDNDELSFGYSVGCCNKKVRTSDIRKVTMLEWQDPVCNWGGWGIRWMIYPHREVGYMPRKGPAIRLELPPKQGKTENQIYVFICSDAKKVKDLLLGAGVQEKV